MDLARRQAALEMGTPNVAWLTAGQAAGADGSVGRMAAGRGHPPEALADEHLVVGDGDLLAAVRHVRRLTARDDFDGQLIALVIGTTNVDR